MLLRTLILLGVTWCRATGQTLTVCDTLANLTNLNGHEIRVRGVFTRGHTGQALYASPPCERPIIRDGWVWRNWIQVYPVNGPESVAEALQRYHEVAKAHPSDNVVVTLAGRLETRDHFELKLYGDGELHPIGFHWCVAKLVYSTMFDFTPVPLRPGELEQDMEVRRSPWAVPAKPDNH